MPTQRQRGLPSAVSDDAVGQAKKRSAFGIGITTLVTIMVVLLLLVFSVLSLVSARSNMHLTQMATDRAQQYYAADGEATVWYAELDTFVARLEGEPDGYTEQLSLAGYAVEVTDTDELRVTNSFAIDKSRMLVVTVAVNEDKTTTIRQWQS